MQDGWFHGILGHESLVTFDDHLMALKKLHHALVIYHHVEFTKTTFGDMQQCLGSHIHLV